MYAEITVAHNNENGHTLMDGGCSLFSVSSAVSLADGIAVGTRRIMTSIPTRTTMAMSSCQSLRDLRREKFNIMGAFHNITITSFPSLRTRKN